MDEAALSDQLVIRRLANGETSVVASLYDQYSARAFGLALKICREQTLAEEALKNAFATLRECHSLFDGERSTLESWFYSIVRTCCIDILRREGRSGPRAPTEILPAHNGNSRTNTQGGLVNQALAALAEADREMILSVYFGGYTHRQLAEKLGLPPETVKNRLRLGFERLSRLLNQGGGPDEM